MNWKTSFIVTLSLYLLKPNRNQAARATCEHCDPTQIQDTYSACGEKPHCLYDANCLDYDGITNDCWCNRYSNVLMCPFGDKCTDTSAGGGSVCDNCEPCWMDGVAIGPYASTCHVDCDGNCVYERKNKNGMIMDCITKGTRPILVWPEVKCKDLGLELTLPHDCQCVSKCDEPYCNSFEFVTTMLRQTFAIDIMDTDVCEDDLLCCCSCPNCKGFSGWPSV
eukprot:33026_1